jgi:hypothetical protein
MVPTTFSGPSAADKPNYSRHYIRRCFRRCFSPYTARIDPAATACINLATTARINPVATTRINPAATALTDLAAITRINSVATCYGPPYYGVARSQSYRHCL